MRTVLLPILLNSACWASSMFGTWKMDAAKSNLAGATQLKSFTVRIEPHARGEVFTLDKVGADGRATTDSVILYFDGQSRSFAGDICSGTISSRRLDDWTAEIFWKCQDGTRCRFIRRATAQRNELTLDITDELPDGRRFERRLVLEKQALDRGRSR